MDNAGLLLSLALEGLATGSIYALVAIGFSLLWWLADIVHLAHGGVMLAAGYVMFYALGALGWPMPVALLAGLAGAAVCSAWRSTARSTSPCSRAARRRWRCSPRRWGR